MKKVSIHLCTHDIISYHMVARVIRINNLTLKNLYHPRHTCITLDYVSGNTSVPRVIQVSSGRNNDHDTGGN